MAANTTISLDRQRASLVAQQRSLLDNADAEKRDMSAEEEAKYDRIDNDVDKLGEQIALAHNTSTGSDGAGSFEGGFDQDRLSALARSGNRRAAFARLAKTGENSPRSAAVGSFCRGGWDGLSAKELASLQVDSGAAGGNLVLPEEFVAQIIRKKDDLSVIRQLATVLPLTSAEAVGVPTLDADPDDADWTGEVNVVAEDAAMSFGKRVLTPHPLSKLVKASRTLIRRSAIPADTLIRDRLGYKFATTEEKGFMSGSGANQALGLFTASQLGISTARDVATDNTATAVTGNGLINALYSLKTPYLSSPSLRWIFHRTIIREVRKIKDSQGQYIWTAGLSGTPDTILEVPYVLSEYAPNTIGANLYVGLLGDLSFYWIVESLRMELQRLDELFTGSNQVGFIGRAEVDGMPVLEEAFARVQLGA